MFGRAAKPARFSGQAYLPVFRGRRHRTRLGSGRYGDRPYEKPVGLSDFKIALYYYSDKTPETIEPFHFSSRYGGMD